jgi:hypothetical protein
MGSGGDLVSTIAERVALGAAFLDEHDPEWWRADVERAIDLDRLDLGDAGLCILGQRCPLELAAAFCARWPEVKWDDELDAAYSAYLVELTGLGYVAHDLDSRADLARWGDEHGFSASEDFLSYPELTAEWARIIRERRSA